MKIIYCHHALRDIGNPPTQEDGLKELGIKDAELVAQILKQMKENGINIKAIYSSEYFRCMETARRINRYLNIPIIKEARFNEFCGVHSAVKGLQTDVNKESWLECQNRIILGIKDIVYSYEETDAVICVTSGVNISSFILLAYGIFPSDNTPFPMVPSCSPIAFDINKDSFKYLK